MAQLTQRMIDIALGRSVSIDADYLRACAQARILGEPPPPEPVNGERTQPSIAESQRAFEMLVKYGGVPTDLAITLTPGEVDARPGTFDPKKLTPAEASAFDAIIRKAAGLDPNPVEPDDVVDAVAVEVRPLLPATSS
jgi:hypothetical protein